MRTRFDVYIGPCSFSSSSFYTQVSNGAKTNRSTPVSTSRKHEGYESFFEAADEKQGKVNTRSSWNDFEHFKRRTFLGKTSSIAIANCDFLAGGSYFDTFQVSDPLWNYSSESWGPAGAPTGRLQPLYQPMPGGHFVVLPSSVNGMIAASLRAMLPHIKNEMSLVNSLIELKDFKTLVRGGAKLLKRLQRANADLLPFLRQLEIAAKKKRQKITLAMIKRGVSDAFLQWEFAYRPLLSDIAAFRKSLSTVQKQVAKLQAEERKKLVRHYYSDCGPGYGPITETLPVNSNAYRRLFSGKTCSGTAGLYNHLGSSTNNRSVSYKAQFHAEVEYSYTFSSFQRENAKMLGLLDSLGVNNNPAIIWNAIPWSFVVDWVFGVSRWLDQFKTANLEPVTLIHRYLYSVSIQRDTVVRVKTNINAPVPLMEYEAVSCTENAFRRVSGIPGQYASALTLSGISPKEMILATALKASRR